MDAMIPDLQAALLCEDVRQEASGSQTLVGVINAIPTPAVPVALFRLCIWTRWCGGLGSFRQTSRIVGPDDSTVVAESAVDFRLADLEGHATNVHYFNGIQFRHFGIHHAEISLDQQLRARFPFAVVRIQQTPQA